ncbi:MAG: nuclear transport factor 2 family protein [Myxococcaceae bacterium]
MSSLVAAAAVTMLGTTPDQEAITRHLNEIWETFNTKDEAKLISFHDYGDNFTAFKDGQPRLDAKGNEANESHVLHALTDAKVEMKDLKMAFYGETAVVTFNGHFTGKLGGQAAELMQQCTIVWVKQKGAWKIVHEHFSLIGPPPKRP